jgi:hypothetical protein
MVCHGCSQNLGEQTSWIGSDTTVYESNQLVLRVVTCNIQLWFPMSECTDQNGILVTFNGSDGQGVGHLRAECSSRALRECSHLAIAGLVVTLDFSATRGIDRCPDTCKSVLYSASSSIYNARAKEPLRSMIAHLFLSHIRPTKHCTHSISTI